MNPSPEKPAQETLAPEKVVASFDSASVLHAATASALRGRNFSHLGNPEPLGRLVRLAGRLPWPLLREVYRRVGGAEGIRPERLARVDLARVAASFVEALPPRRYPALLIGSSNGALAQLAAATQVPWLPQTLLVPVHRVSDPERADLALDFGRRWGPELLQANPDVVLHQMHDVAQDRLMTARMAYFRVKWRTLPPAYRTFLEERLAPRAPIFLLDDQVSWPVTRVAERHWFQTGGLGGLSPEGHLASPYAPAADAEAPEAEWGADPGFVDAVQRWGADHDHPVITLRYRGPQQAAAPAARILREWIIGRGEPGDRMIIPSFVLGDPWRTINRALVPYWTFFPVRDAVTALDDYLARSDRFRTVLVLGFQHGVRSPGMATPDEFVATIKRHGAQAEMLGVRTDRWPHDIGLLGRYGKALDAVPPARQPWSPLSPQAVIDGWQQESEWHR